MLKPVYFPFTHLGDRAAAALQAHFDSILLLRPFVEGLPPGMRELERRGFLEILACAAGDEVSGAEAVAGFLEWAHRHAGGVGQTGAFWQARLAGGSMGRDRSAFQLASQIKRRWPADEKPSAPDPLQTARVFLRLAQELDEQNEELRHELVRCQTLNAEMMAAMAGRPRRSSAGAAGPDHLPPTGREEHRLPERLSAWARLFLVSACPSPVLVTTRAAVVEHVIDACAAARRLPMEECRERGPDPTDASAVPAASLMNTLAGWAAAAEARIETLSFAEPRDVGVPARGDLLGWLLPGDPPHRLLSRLAAMDFHVERMASNAPAWKHTIVILVRADSHRYQSCDR